MIWPKGTRPTTRVVAELMDELISAAAQHHTSREVIGLLEDWIGELEQRKENLERAYSDAPTRTFRSTKDSE